MTPALLGEAGTYLHGERWRLPLALELGKSRRTLTRWEDGESPVPDEDRAKIRALVSEKRTRGKALLAKL